VTRAILSLFILYLSLWAEEHVSEQLWGNVIMGSDQNDKVYLELDLEPKAQIEGSTTWYNIDATGLLEYYPSSWVDLTAEVVTGYTYDESPRSTVELTTRLGIRLHIFGNLRQYIPNKSTLFFERFSLSTLLRYEYRTLDHDNALKEHQSRLRLRIETKTALNHRSYTQDDTYYIFADGEDFISFGEEVKEYFSSKFRIRIGPGYSYNEKHRFELLMLYDFARDTYHDNVRHDAVAVNARYKIFF